MALRKFENGATRDSEAGKLDYEGFLSPLALHAFAMYMDKHRHQSDGTQRASDSWQRGIPPEVYMKSMFRHFMEAWSLHRANMDKDAMPPVASMIDSLCGILFNAQGYLHEYVKHNGYLQYGQDDFAHIGDILKRG